MTHKHFVSLLSHNERQHKLLLNTRLVVMVSANKRSGAVIPRLMSHTLVCFLSVVHKKTTTDTGRFIKHPFY